MSEFEQNHGFCNWRCTIQRPLLVQRVEVVLTLGYDMSWWVIATLEKVGLAKNVVRPKLDQVAE